MLLALGLAGWIVGWILVYPGDFGRSLFVLFTGQWWCPVQPIDLMFLGFCLFLASAVLDFLTKTYSLDRKGLLTILPWITTGQYRYLHEFVWAYQYWITMNVQAGYFSDIITAPSALGGGAD